MQHSNDNDRADADSPSDIPPSLPESPTHMHDPHREQDCGAWKWRENKVPYFSCVCSGNTFIRDYWTARELLSSHPSAADVERSQNRARDYSDRIFSNWRIIHVLVQEYAQSLKRRWVKKSPEVRKNILLEARPKMSKRRGDEWTAMWTKVANRDAFLWPFINVEDLSQGDTALLLLDSRANNLPGVFAQSDLESARMGIVTGAIDRGQHPYLRQYTMAIEEIEDNEDESIESRYGKLYSPEQLDAARADAMEEGKLKKTDFIDHMWTPQPGLLLLEIQAGIMDFLQKLTELILEGVDLTYAIDRAYQLEVVSSSLVGLASDVGSTNLSTIMVQAPYRVPGLLDFEGLLKVVQDKVVAVEEHLRDLYENPGYFAGMLTEDAIHESTAASASAPGSKTRSGRKKASKNPAKSDINIDNPMWNQLLSHLVEDSHSCVALWKTVEHGLDQIRDLHDENAEDILLHFDMPPQYVATLQGFKRVLRQLQQHYVTKFYRGVPKVGSSFKLMAPPVTDPGKNAKRVLPDERVSLLVSVLIDRQFKDAIGLRNIQNQLDDVVRSIIDEGKRHNFSSWHLELLSDLGIVAEIGRQFRLFKHQQMAATAFYDWTSANPDIDFEDAYQVYTAAEEATKSCHDALMVMDLARYGSLEPGRFDYPIDKRRTQVTTEVMIKAEENLDRFWMEVDKQISNRLQIARVHHLFGIRKPVVKRTEPWTEGEPARKPKARVAIASSTHQTARDLSHLHISASAAGPSREFQAPLAPKEERKLKTRNPADPERAEAAADPEAEPEPEDLPFTIAVPRDDYDTILALFFVPDSDPPAEIAWVDFLRTMTRIGFAVSLQRGSEWLFVPDPAQCGQAVPITFHDPHPSKKLDLWVARSNGRRLERKYGWSAETFVVE